MPENLIRTLLETCPAARDNENLLVCSVWSRQLESQHVNTNTMPVYLFMGMLMEGGLTSATEIVKVSNDLQFQYPELRGQSYGWEA